MWWDGRMIKTKFVFAVSMVAMLSCGVAWASVPSESETVANGHEVYTEATNAGTSTATNLATGIAGVTYVNRMVNTAGNAAQLAEDHAAAAGAYAIQAEKAANTAKNALSGKLDNKFAANKNAIVTTDKDGNVKPVAILDTESGTYITDVTVSDTGVVTLSRGSSDSGDVTGALGYTPENVANKVKIADIEDCFGENPPASCEAIIFSDDKYYSAYSTYLLLLEGMADATQDMEVTTNKVGANNFTSGSTTQYTSVAAAEQIAANAAAARVASDQGQSNINKTMVTNAQGKVVAGSITRDPTNDGQFVTGASVSNGNVVLSAYTPDGIDVEGWVGYPLENANSRLRNVNNAANLTDVQWRTDEFYPSMNTATKMIDYKIATNNDDITGAISDVSNAKVSIAQTAQNANKAMITDAQGNVTTGQIAKGMLASGIFGYIPTNSNGTGSAQIWVE